MKNSASPQFVVYSPEAKGVSMRGASSKGLLKVALISNIFLFVNTSSYAQESIGRFSTVTHYPHNWFVLGIGQTNGHLGFGGGLYVGLGGTWSLGLRGGFRAEPSLVLQPGETAWWVNPMMHFTPVYGSIGMVTIGIGAGLTGGLRRGKPLRIPIEHERITYRVPSASAELQLAFFATRSLGLTATVFTNVNKEQNQTGFLVGVQLRR